MTEEEVTVTRASNPSDVWIRFRKASRGKKFIAILTVHDHDLNILPPAQRSRLQPHIHYPVYTLAILGVDDIRKIFRAVKRGKIGNPITFTLSPS